MQADKIDLPCYLDRDEYQDLFLEYMEKMKFLSDCGWDERYYGGFENDIFYLKSYHWMGCTCGFEEPEVGGFSVPEEHNFECLIYKPNFIFKPTKWMLSWYKYPLRGNSCSSDLTVEKFKHMLEECEMSMRG